MKSTFQSGKRCQKVVSSPVDRRSLKTIVVALLMHKRNVVNYFEAECNPLFPWGGGDPKGKGHVKITLGRLYSTLPPTLCKWTIPREAVLYLHARLSFQLFSANKVSVSRGELGPFCGQCSSFLLYLTHGTPLFSHQLVTGALYLQRKKIPAITATVGLALEIYNKHAIK